jgi:hypothetical protein
MAVNAQRDYLIRMTQSSGPSSIPVGDLKIGSIPIIDELHFTGGLRAGRAGGGWQIGPLLRNGGVGFVSDIPEREIRGIGTAMGLTLFGAEEISAIDPNLPARVWRPLFGPPVLAHAPSDTWGMIGSSARAAGDDSYLRLARNLAVSLRAAGLQLRNASNEYYKQLYAALMRSERVGTRFANLSMLEVHLAFHSVLAEMASARDYLAQVAAQRVNAPTKIDALNRHKEWVEKSANAAARKDPLVLRL